MLKPVCVGCQRFFRIKKSGYYFTEGMPVGPDRALPGTAEPESWRPYKVWASDLWECEGCGTKILSGFGVQPLSVQYEADFAAVRSRHGADQFQVNDC